MRLSRVLVIASIAALLMPGPVLSMGEPGVAALQVALRAKGVYRGPVDGVRGESTRAAVVRFQQRAGLLVDGVAGPQTRKALGRRGRPALGVRDIGFGAVGWDVAALQFQLAWHGFPSGRFDGRFGVQLDSALRGFQTWAGLAPDGVAGRNTLAALRKRPPRAPVRLRWPIGAPVHDVFGPRGARFHAGVDFAAGHGAPVTAARTGAVVFAGRSGSYGRLVVLAHRSGVETFYAHLSRIDVTWGQRVRGGRQVGLVGSSGRATGPHLHFEVRVRGASIDPLPALR